MEKIHSDVSHLGYKYQQPSGGAIGTGYSSSGSSGNGFSGGNNELESLNNMNEGVDSEDLSSSTFHGISSYDAPYVSGNNYAGNGYTDSASFGSSSSSVTAGSGYSNGYSGQGSGSPGNGLSSGISNDFGGSSSGGFSGSSSGGFSGGSSSNGYSGSSSSGFSGSSSNGFSGGNGQAGFGGTAGGVNLIQGQSQSIDLSGGSSGGQRVVYKPVIKQGEPIITKNFYVVRRSKSLS